MRRDSGPRAIHLLNGLYDAKLDHQPVVAVAGQTCVRTMGGHFQQEVDLLSLYVDVAAAYVRQVDAPEAAPRAGPRDPDRQGRAHGHRRDRAR